MSDIKSKLPDLKELASMTSKLYKDIKASVGQIVQDYKDVRVQSEVDGSQAEEIKKTEEPKVNEKSKAEDKKQ